jgi:hypothetical protein
MNFSIDANYCTLIVRNATVRLQIVIVGKMTNKQQAYSGRYPSIKWWREGNGIGAACRGVWGG